MYSIHYTVCIIYCTVHVQNVQLTYSISCICIINCTCILYTMYNIQYFEMDSKLILKIICSGLRLHYFSLFKLHAHLCRTLFLSYFFSACRHCFFCKVYYSLNMKKHSCLLFSPIKRSREIPKNSIANSIKSRNSQEPHYQPAPSNRVQKFTRTPLSACPF